MPDRNRTISWPTGGLCLFILMMTQCHQCSESTKQTRALERIGDVLRDIRSDTRTRP